MPGRCLKASETRAALLISGFLPGQGWGWGPRLREQSFPVTDHRGRLPDRRQFPGPVFRRHPSAPGGPCSPHGARVFLIPHCLQGVLSVSSVAIAGVAEGGGHTRPGRVEAVVPTHGGASVEACGNPRCAGRAGSVRRTRATASGVQGRPRPASFRTLCPGLHGSLVC